MHATPPRSWLRVRRLEWLPGVPHMQRALRAALLLGLAASVVWLSRARADDGTPGSADPAAATAVPDAPPIVSTVAPPAGTTAREAQLEERVRQVEQANRQLLQKVDMLTKQYEAMSRNLPAPPAARPAEAGTAPTVEFDEGNYETYPGGTPVGPEGTIGRGTPSSRYGRTGGSIIGEEGAVASYRFAPPSPVRTSGDTTRGGGPYRGPEGTIGRRGTEGESRPIKTTIGNGVRFDTDDGEFQLQFHDLTQSELRNFPGVGNQSPLKTQFFVPRQRWYFTGRATKNVEFYTDVNRGYGSLDLLDAFLNFNFDPRVQFRAGRFKTPASYEYYMITEGDLIAPERSLFTSNLSGNRQDGFMFHGVIFDKRAEWAIGTFNGPRRSFQDYNSDKDLYLFYNMRPWQNSDIAALKILNVGGAFNFGNERNPTQPSILTTANDETSASNSGVVESLSPTFFAFNNNVVESGARAEWSAWIAWYYKSFNVLLEYDGGYQEYATSFTGPRTRVPLEGFSITPYYFITGEQLTRRVDVRPNRDFAIRNGRITGPGAVEIYSRFSALNIGRDVFAAGLADPNDWSNQAYAIDTGFNWYLNRYTKIYVDWQHSVFGNPVYNGVGSQRSTVNLIWLRFQVFF